MFRLLLLRLLVFLITIMRTLHEGESGKKEIRGSKLLVNALDLSFPSDENPDCVILFEPWNRVGSPLDVKRRCSARLRRSWRGGGAKLYRVTVGNFGAEKSQWLYITFRGRFSFRRRRFRWLMGGTRRMERCLIEPRHGDGECRARVKVKWWLYRWKIFSERRRNVSRRFLRESRWIVASLEK